MIRHCYDTVPYYKKCFDEGGIDPQGIRRLEDLKVLPILTKNEVNRQPEMFLSTAYPVKRMITAHTSGTTGAGFVFKTTQRAICEQWAVWWRYRRRLGIEFGTISANFGTRFIVPVDQNRPPFWRYNKPCNQVYFSAFHEKPEYLKYYIREIERQKLAWIHGYPSLLATLADEVLRENDQQLQKQIKFVTIGAENLLEHQAASLRRAFNVHVYQHYGLSEGVANFSEMPDKTILVDEDFAAVEFVEEGNHQRVIGTGLTNRAMPLLRWDTKDMASCIETKRGREIPSIDGRIEDYVTLQDGRKIGKLDHVFKDAVHIKEVQIRQKTDYSIQALIVPRDKEYWKDIALASKLFKRTLGEDIDVEFKTVDQIEKSKSGKLRFIISDIKERDGVDSGK